MFVCIFLLVYLSSSDLTILSKAACFVKHFFQVFFKSEAEKEGFEPSRRYSRPAPFPGVSLQPLGYFSKLLNLTRDRGIFKSDTKRRWLDSNPRALSDKRFSRPPRYDHFDTSPYLFFLCALCGTSDNIHPF